MKRIVLTLMVISLLSVSSAAFAAGELGIGAISTPTFGSSVDFSSTPVPCLRYRFSEKFTGDVALAIASSGDDSAFGLNLRGAISVQKKGGVELLIPIGIDYTSAKIGGGDTVTAFTLKGGFGVETFIKSNFSVAFDLYPIMLVSPSEGDTTFVLLGGGAIMAHYYL